jgi:hypothetical protein
MITELMNREDYPWLEEGKSLHRVTDGIHEGKLVEVLAAQSTVDLNNDGVPDRHYIKLQARRVDDDGNTILVRDTPLILPETNPGISWDAMANGQDAMLWVAGHIDQAITKLLNLENNMGAFAFLPAAQQ